MGETRPWRSDRPARPDQASPWGQDESSPWGEIRLSGSNPEESEEPENRASHRTRAIGRPPSLFHLPFLARDSCTGAGRSAKAGEHDQRQQPVDLHLRSHRRPFATTGRKLVPTPPVSDLFGTTGRNWLGRQVLPADERAPVQALLRQLDFHGDELKLVDTELALEAIGDPVVAQLMTIPGVDAIAAVAIVAAVGDFTRFGSADKLVAYVGLNPTVRQSGNSAPVQGSDQQSRPVTRPWSAGGGGLVGTTRSPGPARSPTNVASWSSPRAPPPTAALPHPGGRHTTTRNGARRRTR